MGGSCRLVWGGMGLGGEVGVVKGRGMRGVNAPWRAFDRRGEAIPIHLD